MAAGRHLLYKKLHDIEYSSIRLRVRGLAFAVLITSFWLILTLSAHAGSTPPMRLTAADQAIARSIVLRQSDLGPASVWHGGMTKPAPSVAPDCPGYHPDESDLPITGDAESKYINQAAGIEYDSEAQVLQTAKMVTLDWQQSIQPGLIPCVRSAVAKDLPRNETLVSVAWVSVPKISTFTAEYRIVFDVHRSTAPKTVRLFSDNLLVGYGRAEITLATSAQYAARAPVQQSEFRLARLLVRRIPTRD